MTASLQRKYQAVIVLALAVLIASTSCRHKNNVPQKSSREYNDAVSVFYVSLAALQVGDDVRADAKLSQLTQLVPEEPAGWGNWGVLALRQRNFDPAADRLEKARALAPESDQIEYLLGLLESGRGRSAEAISALQKAIALRPANLIATFKLAEETERLNSENSSLEFQRLVEKILAVQPNNLAALIELARIASKRGDTQTLLNAVNKIAERSANWPGEVQQQVTALRTAASGSDPSAAAVRVAFLRNVLVRVPEYRQDLAMIKPPPGEEAQPFTRMLSMETPTFASSAPDTDMTFTTGPSANAPEGKWDWIGPISLDGEGPPTLAFANAHELHIGNGSYPFPGGTSSAITSAASVTALDFNYDFKTDLVLAGDGGLRLLKQDNGKFIDVTADAKLSPGIVNGRYLGSTAADIDADGDLDVVLFNQQGAPTVLRNNGDGSFLETHPFSGNSGLRAFVWADLDGDGDPDAALLDNSNAAGNLHVFLNERSGQFTQSALPNSTQTQAIAVSDQNGDGTLDLLAAQGTAINRYSDRNEAGWETATVLSFTLPQGATTTDMQLLVTDLDNNGANDLILTMGAAAPLIWLGDNDNRFVPFNQTRVDNVVAVADVDGDGRLDLLALGRDGAPSTSLNHGTKNYHWQLIRPRAAKAVGDQRINSFGIGGEMEIRSGLLVQKQLVTGPLVHFGLGEHTGADVVRIVWPNGAVRAEFETKADQAILAEQRLKGSCPFLFAWNGKEVKFVKDAVPWSSAIGLRINTLGTAKVEATEEWYKIRGDQLAPHDGYYDLRITAELWETYYYDHLSLMTVDHPVGTDVFVDERFVIPPAPLAITTVSTPHKIARAVDDNGNDVTSVVNSLDENYLDTFGRGRYQGVTRDHYVEVDLGDEIPASGPLYLIAHGWMHPTDSSINVAISQGNNAPARPLSLELPDGKGGWFVAKPNLGFPAGRKKISLIDLTNLFKPGMPHKLRLRTTLEVYWDCLEWAQGEPGTQLKTTRLAPDVADLHFRGFSVIDKANESSPEIPDYNKIASSKQVWRDLIGYYTRFGDVRELLNGTDDRYVIMNAGDEMTFHFKEQPPPPWGWTRDFLIIGDGWIKDGDYNSTFSKTVLPLPYHARQEYTTAPTSLEEEFVYKRFPDDWQKFHTRYVTPDVFRNALRVR